MDQLIKTFGTFGLGTQPVQEVLDLSVVDDHTFGILLAVVESDGNFPVNSPLPKGLKPKGYLPSKIARWPRLWLTGFSLTRGRRILRNQPFPTSLIERLKVNSKYQPKTRNFIEEPRTI